MLVSYSWDHSEALFRLQVTDVLTNDKDYKSSHGERKKRGLAIHEADYVFGNSLEKTTQTTDQVEVTVGLI